MADEEEKEILKYGLTIPLKSQYIQLKSDTVVPLDVSQFWHFFFDDDSRYTFFDHSEIDIDW